MATKRKTDHDSPRQRHGPETPAAKAAPADGPGSSERREEPSAPPASEPAAQERSNEEPKERPNDRPGGKPDARTEPAASADPAPAERRVAELVSQLDEANARHLRLAADFENYKKRIRQEQIDTMRYAAATVAERLLPVLDDADRALSHAPEGVAEWLKGVRLTFQKLEEVLASVGVERIEALGAPFDPKQHEAVSSEETAKHAEDTVVAELRAGYRMHDRVLRPALVKVARPPA